jgi:hypothetical protein
MNRYVRELRRLEMLTRIRAARLAIASVEVSRLRGEQLRTAGILAQAQQRRDGYERTVVDGAAWADSAGEIRRAEVISEEARHAAGRAWKSYRQVCLRREMLQFQWSRRRQAVQRKKQALEEEDR